MIRYTNIYARPYWAPAPSGNRFLMTRPVTRTSVSIGSLITLSVSSLFTISLAFFSWKTFARSTATRPRFICEFRPDSCLLMASASSNSCYERSPFPSLAMNRAYWLVSSPLSDNS